MPLLILVAGLSPAKVVAQDVAPSPDQVRFFESQIRPVLVDQCYKCHGPQKQKAGLRLDSRTALLAGGDTGPAVVPGKVEESLLIGAIRHGDDGPKMPPAKKLPDNQVADLTRWVEMGSPWPGGDVATGDLRKGPFKITDQDRNHWAFRPIGRPAVPAVGGAAGVVNPIDAFLMAQLATKGLKPNPPAETHELLRRLYYDLTGLPPTPREVESFLADRSPTAYEDLVDRLLASPRYGEAWGRHWLDLVRYAETNSYERDGAKPNAWRYRDYVIRAFNQDKPYDRFVREQIAGDELPDGGADGLIATGFYRLGIWDDEPADREQALYDNFDDVVATTGQAFLGLTVDCARCHDHKLDPIPQADYYRLLSFFRNLNAYRNGGPTDEAPIFADAAARRQYAERVRERDEKIRATRSALAAIEDDFREKYEASRREPVAEADIEDLRFRYCPDQWDKLPDFELQKFEAIGTLPGGMFDINQRSRDDAFGFVFDGTLLVPAAGTYTFRLDSDDGARLIVAGKRVIDHDGIHEMGAEQVGSLDLPAGGVPIRLEYFQRTSRMGLNVTWSGPGFDRRPLSAPVGPRGQATPKRASAELAQQLQAEGANLLGKETFDRYQALKAELKATKEAVIPADRALSVSEPGTAAPETFVLLRGNPKTPGDRVEPAYLQVLGGTAATIPPPSPGARTSGRREALANWIASADNPLAARVMANRVWQHHFGRGIVRSPNNFGLQGDKPTQPALLDWLASELIRQDWRLKPLHRLIVTSAAYRMSSRANPEALKADPTNDHFWRFDMRRLSAEEIRDSVLDLSGTLNFKMGGPGIYPEIPASVMAGQSQPGLGWGKSTPEEQARRSVYVFIKRSLLTPILESFDVAETDRSTPVRFATTQPTQALSMINGEFLNQQAATLAGRLKREAGADTAAQVNLALRLATARTPSPVEVARGVGLIESLQARDGLDPDAALSAFCLAVLNLNEFLHLD